jgi:hypothetical protein
MEVGAAWLRLGLSRSAVGLPKFGIDQAELFLRIQGLSC